MFLVAMGLAGCGRGDRRATHLPVDPALDLGIVVPKSTKQVQVGFVYVERAELYADPSAWAVHVGSHNKSYAVGEPTQDGDGWALALTARDPRLPDVPMWYRPLGGGLAITCSAITDVHAPTFARELTRKICFGTQRVTGGIFVPFQFLKHDKYTSLVLLRSGERHSWSVSIERAADSPAWRFDRKGASGEHRVIDEGTVAGGSWFISGAETRVAGTEYRVVARRTIGSLELACHGDTYMGKGYARQQLKLCLGLRKP